MASLRSASGSLRRPISTYDRINALATVVATLLIAACGANVRGTGPVAGFQSGDYIITQESPEVRQRERSQSAGSFIFHLAQSGDMRTIASPPGIVGPRGIRALGSGQFVFADALGAAIRIMNSQGHIRTLYAGSPLTQPKDVAVDRDGGYVVADFDTFRANGRASIFKVTDSGKVTTVYTGRPLRQPHGIDVDKEGNYIVADHTGSVFRISPRGEIVTVATTGLTASQDVKVDNNGDYIVTDIGLVIDETTGRVDPARSMNPTKLLKITPSGQVSVIAVRPRSRFRAVALHPDGSYVVVDLVNALYRITPDGHITVIYEGSPLHQPAGVAIVP